ncbi:unnamed protein product [Lactuca saligna]|uniref:Uncharacterized protein n=1 Tax=Lactuca saligna TaxID=75948 RepID=A0AA36EFM6_LACSI|nr:unnamed protein product [Lactuca saligna]
MYRRASVRVSSIRDAKMEKRRRDRGGRRERADGDEFRRSSEASFLDDEECFTQSQNFQWVQGKAGEDRVHVIVYEEQGWVSFGIYDGFNGPDAPYFLLSNMYQCVYKQLKGLLWDDKLVSSNSNSSV